MNVNVPARENVEKLTITKNADGTLAGKWVGQRGESKISNMKFEGGKLTFIRTSDFGGRIMESEFEGTVTGDAIKGVFKSDRGDREANATRVSRHSRAEQAGISQTGCAKTQIKSHYRRTRTKTPRLFIGGFLFAQFVE